MLDSILKSILKTKGQIPPIFVNIYYIVGTYASSVQEIKIQFIKE